jgi:hypothetical protein
VNRTRITRFLQRVAQEEDVVGAVLDHEDNLVSVVHRLKATVAVDLPFLCCLLN